MVSTAGIFLADRWVTTLHRLPPVCARLQRLSLTNHSLTQSKAWVAAIAAIASFVWQGTLVSSLAEHQDPSDRNVVRESHPLASLLNGT
jgi:hypothetical protein